MKKVIKINNNEIFKDALKESFIRLNPKHQIKNPVIFAVTLSSAFCTALFLTGNFDPADFWFNLQLLFWLWFTVLFANFAEALAEGRGKAQASSLRQTQSNLKANRLIGNEVENVDASLLLKGDVVIVKAGELIPADGEVIEGVASVDESAITGESAPVVREHGGDRSAVTGGTRVLSDRILVKITSKPGATIGALLSAIGIAGMDRLVQRNVLAMSGRAVEAAGDVTTLLLDKTGTITY